MRFFRHVISLSLAALPACDSSSQTVTVGETELATCPLDLRTGQTLVVSLESNPSTGYGWQVVDAAPDVLKSLGDETWTSDHPGVPGSSGVSTWRYDVYEAGTGRLHMEYRQAWDTTVPALKTVDCEIVVPPAGAPDGSVARASARSERRRS